MVAVTEEETAWVVTVNVAELDPAATITDPGTIADVLVLDSETTVPEGPAAPLRLTVPVAVKPPPTDEGLTTTDERSTSSTVNDAVTAVLPVPAVIVAVVGVLTFPVVALKVAEVSPAGTTTVEGTTTAALLDFSGIETPPNGASLASVMVPVELSPLGTELGSIESDFRLSV